MKNKYNKFIIEFFEYLKKQPKYIRTGQALMNFLFEFDHFYYYKITTQEVDNYDCFYRDDLIFKTLEYLQKEWEKNDKINIF